MRSSALVAACLLAAAAALPAEMLERIMAVIDERPLFLSDVRAVESLDGIGQKDALERLIDETLLVREAERLPPPTATPPPDGASLAESTPAPSPTPSPASPAAARALERRATIRRYVAFRFQPQVRVDDDDVRKAYAQEWRGREDAPPLIRVAAEIRERLTAGQVDARVAAWVRDLRTAARIRYNAPD